MFSQTWFLSKEDVQPVQQNQLLEMKGELNKKKSDCMHGGGCSNMRNPQIAASLKQIFPCDMIGATQKWTVGDLQYFCVYN